MRGDQFTLPDETDRSAADELGEHAILSMIASVEEKRIPFLANFYTALYFDTSIDRSSVPALIKVVDGLSYRGMCILNIVGRGQLYTGNPGREHGEAKAWPVSDHFLAKSIFDMIGIVIQRQLDSQYDNAIIGYDEVDPALMKLGLLGDQLFDKMKLDGMSSDDPDLIETENALKRIAAAPLGGPDLVKVFEDAASPKWSVSEW